MLSRCTIGAIASKNASASSPVTRRIDCASSGEVSGPVATITWPDGRIGQRRHRLAADLDQHLGLQRILHGRGKTVPIDRERAARRQLVRIARAHDEEPQRRISSCSSPTALCKLSSERNELEQTSSASVPVLCAAVVRAGRISWRIDRDTRPAPAARLPRCRRARHRSRGPVGASCHLRFTVLYLTARNSFTLQRLFFEPEPEVSHR